MNATPEMLASLAPGELLVRIIRDGWTIAPNHVAIARANQALCNFATAPGTYRGNAPNSSQTECLEGAV